MSDPNKAAKLEKAISQKWGTTAIINPKSLWSESDEEEYIKGKQAIKSQNITPTEQVEISGSSGIKLESKLIKERDSRICTKCGVYSFEDKDDVYLCKFGFCYKCFLLNEFTLRNKGTIK